jgi:hypothetical protein
MKKLVLRRESIRTLTLAGTREAAAGVIILVTSLCTAPPATERCPEHTQLCTF